MTLNLFNKFIKQLSQRERIILYLTILTLAGWIGFARIVEPLVRRLKGLNEDLTAKELKLVKGEKLLNSQKIIEEEFSQRAENLKFAGSQEQLISSLLNKIEELADASGVHITNIKPQRIKQDNFYQKTLIEMKFDGAISNIIKFLHSLEASVDLIEIERLQINTKTKETDILDAITLISKISLLDR